MLTAQWKITTWNGVQTWESRQNPSTNWMPEIIIACYTVWLFVCFDETILLQEVGHATYKVTKCKQWIATQLVTYHPHAWNQWTTSKPSQKQLENTNSSWTSRIWFATACFNRWFSSATSTYKTPATAPWLCLVIGCPWIRYISFRCNKQCHGNATEYPGITNLLWGYHSDAELLILQELTVFDKAGTSTSINLTQYQKHLTF